MHWIEKYRPKTFEEIVGQDEVLSRLKACSARQSIPHLILAGPHGTGKSVAIESLSRELYGDSCVENTTVINTSDILRRGRSGLEQDQRFMHLYKKDESLLANFKYIIRWYASLQPINTRFKLFVFEDAHELTHDAQASLRRTMEKYSPTCRFIFETTRPSGIIPAISSRCLPLHFGPLAPAVITGVLQQIMALEQVSREKVPSDLLDLIIMHSQGDLRRAVMLLEIASRADRPFDIVASTRSEAATVAASAFGAMQDRDIPAAQRRLESLMLEYGFSGEEVLSVLLDCVHSQYNDPRIVSLIGETDAELVAGNNEYLLINALAARIVTEVFL